MKTSPEIQLQYEKSFLRQTKKLKKKHASLGEDLEAFFTDLKNNPAQGVLIRPNVRKIRMSVSSKNKGKRGGLRVITYFDVLAFAPADEAESQTVILLTLYDKSEKENLTTEEIDNLIAQIDF